jgi:arylsulfatase A-like enzyme
MRVVHGAIAGLLLVALGLPLTAAAQAQRPDVLFIAVDDLNDWVGYLGGHPQTKTPNIDRLAARGMAFTNAHSPSALCNPSRTALLTGLRPATTGIYGNAPDWRDVEIFKEIATLPRYFRDSGYRTLGAGKIFHAHTFGASGFAGYNDTTAWDAFYPELNRQLPDEVGPPTRPANGNTVGRTFDWSAVVTDDAAMGDGQVVSWIERQLLAETGSPRFIAEGIYRPHLPWYVPQKYFDLHPLETIELPPYRADDLDDVPEIARPGEFGGVEAHEWITGEDRWAEGVQAYLASVSFADTMVGQLIDALDASGRADNTIIVLWGDHGYHLGEKSRWHKSTLWEESTHVPLIIVVPGVTTPDSRTAHAVSLMDIYPTLAELAGLETPSHVEGRSLVPLLEDPSREWDFPVLTTYGFDNHAVRTDRYRYIRYADGSEELYDHESDPNEWTNLAGDRAYDGLKAELHRALPAQNAADLAPPPPQPARSPKETAPSSSAPSTNASDASSATANPSAPR